ncbi:MAG: lysoplasmalogenase [Bacteroidaceae bacterium]|nr:lysoplasmalogenase [Bacteroidaceae bacterium]
MLRQIALAILVYIILSVLDFMPLHYPSLMIFPLAWLTLCALYKRQWALSAALFFSFMGDVMGWKNELIPQIGSFALAQIVYIILFTLLMPPRVAWPKSVRMLFLVLVLMTYGIAMYWIFPKVEDKIIASGIAVYAVLLLGMCYSALRHRNVCLMLGATLFVISDFILGTHLFVQRIPHAHLLIMIPYYLGQGLLFIGVLNMNKMEVK